MRAPQKMINVYQALMHCGVASAVGASLHPLEQTWLTFGVRWPSLVFSCALCLVPPVVYAKIVRCTHKLLAGVKLRLARDFVNV